MNNPKSIESSTASADGASNEDIEIAEASAAPKTHQHPDMKRSAVKELIERYFYQLQKGCGNPKCANNNCASSGQVANMGPNEIAAKAIQLFSQDAKLCDIYNQQPPKVARTQNQDSPSSSRRAIGGQLDEEMLSPADSSSSGHSTITSGSSSSSSSSNTTNSTNTDISSCPTEEGPLHDILGCTTDELTPTNHTSFYQSSKQQHISEPSTPTLAPVEFLNEQIVDDLIEEAKASNNYERLLNSLQEVFTNVNKLSKSFCHSPEALAVITSCATASKLHELLGKSPGDLKKEDLRTLEGDKDKDEDCSNNMEEEGESSNVTQQNQADTDICMNSGTAVEDEEMELDLNQASTSASATSICTAATATAAATSSNTEVDLESLRCCKKKLYSLEESSIGEAINRNVILLAEHIKYSRETDWEKILHCFVICFDMATNTSNRFADLEYLERSLPKLCHAARVLPISAQARLAHIWATHCKDQLHSLVQCCQQLITLQVILDEDSVQENNNVIAVTKVLKIAFYANILTGKMDSKKAWSSDITQADAGSSSSNAAANDDDDIFFYSQVAKPQYTKFAENKLEKELQVCAMDCRVPLVPFEEFYNEALSDAIQMDRDYLSYKNLSLDPSNEDAHFCFMLYSFILTPATKVIALYYDSRIRMYTERSSSLYSLLNYLTDSADMSTTRPDLKLKVRRDNIIDDALIGLELVAMSNPKDLKKQLVVEFVGEQGIDEGGVSKEFFQLIVEEIFNPDFGMFIQQEDTNTVWFNSSPFENEAQFTLVGIILGLAIYNNIILAVNFPMVVYRKLMGGRGTFFDLNDWNPTLWRSLKSMLDYQEADMDEVFMQTFKISYKDVFGEVVEHELKPGGADIVVDQHNKEEFVDLYSDFLLNQSIDRQFKAFKKGFEMVTDESPLKLLFHPEEVELLVCGSRNFDFLELEISTEYEGGYDKETQVIKDFWEVVHSMPEESKRKLLEFTTGSDRVPVGGLSRLKLLITRHGSDSDRLPTSHTCFNVLLLPEYSSKEKLEERLLKAINYSKGFGLL